MVTYSRSVCKRIETHHLTFTDTLSQLDQCGTEIDAACSFPVDEEAMSALEQCYTDATDFLDKVDNCLNPQFIDQQGCACFAAIQVGDLLDKVVACDTKAANDLVKTEKKKCIKSKLITAHVLSTVFPFCRIRSLQEC